MLLRVMNLVMFSTIATLSHWRGCLDWRRDRPQPERPFLGGVDGFDQDEGSGEGDDGCEVSLGLFAT